MSERAFDKFTKRAKQVLQIATEEARAFNHPYIGTEHILLGLIREGEGVAARVLDDLGVKLSQARHAVEFIVGMGEGPTKQDQDLTARAKKVIAFAVDEAKRLNHHYIGTEHLLLGLVRIGEGVAAGVLDIMGVSREQVRTQVMRVLRQATGGGPIGGGDLHVRSGGGTIEGRVPHVRSERPTNRESEGAFNKFNKRSRQVLEIATEEAQAFNHPYIGTGHILLGLIREGEGVAARVLDDLEVEFALARRAVEVISRIRNEPRGPDQDLTPRAKRVIAFAVDEAKRLNHRYIGTEHLLLALVAIGEGVAADVFYIMGVSLGQVHTQVMRVLHSGEGEGTSD
jgi:ATP-dependent Clp protease ATP-binding subunit ClpA